MKTENKSLPRKKPSTMSPLISPIPKKDIFCFNYPSGEYKNSVMISDFFFEEKKVATNNHNNYNKKSAFGEKNFENSFSDNTPKSWNTANGNAT
jgi:hypothetical protein